MSKLSESKKRLTGYASGYVNLTINTQITLNITQETVNFSSGTMTPGPTNATLRTVGIGAMTAIITGGNWSADADALSFANIGNINCSISAKGNKNSQMFFGGGISDRAYQWNFSNKDPNSCGAWNETSARNVFADVNITTAIICSQLDYDISRNEMLIDFKLVVPYNSNQTNTPISDIITITGNVALP